VLRLKTFLCRIRKHLSEWPILGHISTKRSSHCRSLALSVELQDGGNHRDVPSAAKYFASDYLVNVSSIAMGILTHGAMRGVRVKGGRGEEGRVKGGRGGIKLHSSTLAKMRGQQFRRGGGIGLHSSTNAKMHSQHFWRGRNAWSAILEGRKCVVSNFGGEGVSDYTLLRL